MLAEFSTERIREVFDQWGLSRHTENIISDVDETLDGLEQAHEQGYAVNRQEQLEGLYSVALVINN